MVKVTTIRFKNESIVVVTQGRNATFTYIQHIISILKLIFRNFKNFEKISKGFD